jgi:hypothetical protein
MYLYSLQIKGDSQKKKKVLVVIAFAFLFPLFSTLFPYRFPLFQFPYLPCLQTDESPQYWGVCDVLRQQLLSSTARRHD